MKELEKLLAQARRIEEHRTVEAELAIRKTYKKVLNELRSFIGVEYAKLAEDDKLTYEILQRNNEYARFLDEIEQRINGISPEVSQEIRSLVEQTYEIAYTGMVDAVDKAAGGESLEGQLEGLKAVSPEVIKKAVENPIAGLTLSDTLEKHRKEIIYDIKRNIGVGLANGDRMSTMANRIKESIDGDYKKAIRIARTEAHRVREAGHGEAAVAVNESLKNGTSGMVMMKTWRTMKDSRVRKPKGKNKADHVKMDGVQIPVDAEFDLGHGVKTKEPGNSGSAGDDINCRCYLSYDLVEMIEAKDLTYKDFQGLISKNYNEAFIESNIGKMDKQIDKYKEKFKKFTGFDYDFTMKMEGGQKGYLKTYQKWKKDGVLSPEDTLGLEMAINIKDLENMKVYYNESLTKIKNKKLKKDLLLQQKDLQKQVKEYKVDVYKGIWLKDVTVKDYEKLKEKLDAKKSYFSSQIENAEDAGDFSAQAKFEDLLNLCYVFEDDGETYLKLTAKLKEVEDELAKLTKAKPKKTTAGFSADAYTQSRKDNALWTSDKKAVDKALRKSSGEAWQNASEIEKDGAYKYTAGSGGFNRPLRGYDGSWYNFKGVGKVDLDTEGRGKYIESLTNLIDKSEIPVDIWMSRGIETARGAASFLGIDEDLLNAATLEELQQLLTGKVLKDEAFVSCGSAKGSGFRGYMFKIYCPKGTKGLYAEPFSEFGDGDGRSWDGVSEQSRFGSEFETILQRGTSFKVTKIEGDSWNYTFEIEVVGQI